MQYGISSRGLAHVIKDHPNNGWCGFWLSVCGKEFHPIKVVDSVSDDAKLCSICKKHLEAR